MLVVPDGPPPADGRPVVSWQHPTSGVDRLCAPSLSRDVLKMIMGLPELLKRGYAVVAPDYPGLGTPGPHPYLVGESEGHAVLDAVRAARNAPEAHAGQRFAVWGHSQGGHATLFAGLLAQSYAPELQLVGAAAAAPAYELDKLFGATAPEVTADYMARLCKAGVSVRMVEKPGVVHRLIACEAADEAVRWIGDRFAGLPAPSDCP